MQISKIMSYSLKNYIFTEKAIDTLCFYGNLAQAGEFRQKLSFFSRKDKALNLS